MKWINEVNEKVTQIEAAKVCRVYKERQMLGCGNSDQLEDVIGWENFGGMERWIYSVWEESNWFERAAIWGLL